MLVKHGGAPVRQSSSSSSSSSVCTFCTAFFSRNWESNVTTYTSNLLGEIFMNQHFGVSSFRLRPFCTSCWCYLFTNHSAKQREYWKIHLMWCGESTKQNNKNAFTCKNTLDLLWDLMRIRICAILRRSQTHVLDNVIDPIHPWTCVDHFTKLLKRKTENLLWY